MINKWHPIETCPEDCYVFVWVRSKNNKEYGRRIEVCKTKNHSAGWVGVGVGELDYFSLKRGDIYFSHWLHLPQPPKED